MSLNISQPESYGKLKELLNVNHETFKISFDPNHFANHLVHALCSLYYSGASPNQLQEFFDFYTNKLEKLEDAKYEINRKNWTDFFGKRDNYTEYLIFFQEQINEQGMLEVLDEFLPRLIPGLAAAALHPLIHLGYAIEFDLPHVAAEALAYACAFYFPLGELIDNLPQSNESKSISELLNIASSLDVSKLGGKGLRKKLENVADTYGHLLPELIAKWKLTEDPQVITEKSNELTRESLKLFADSTHLNKFDFFLLHQVTGNHAVRTLLPILPQKQQIRLLRINLLTYFVLFIAMGAPTLDKSKITSYSSDTFREVNDWKQLLKKSTYHKDEHLIKVIRNIYQFDAEHGTQEEHPYYYKIAVKAWDSMQNGGKWYFNGIGFSQKNSPSL